MAEERSHTTLPTFSNSPGEFLPEALAGLVAAHPNASWYEQGFIGRSRPAADGQVAVLSGGGSGHEPLHAGFVGTGMLTAAVPGHMFTSPNAVQVTAATRWADGGAGVVQVVKNYTGDVLNFRVARQALRGEVDTRHVLVDDDVATEDADGPGRRGTGATVLVEKVCGAAAQRGDTVDEVARIGSWVADNSRSMAVALNPGHLPGAARPTFDLPEGQMEVGVGIHGERGVDRRRAGTAREIVAEIIERTTASLGLERNEQIVCVVNGLGAATSLELHLVFREVLSALEERGITVARSAVGNLVTAVNMAGVSVTLSRTTDETTALYDAPTDAPGWPALGRPGTAPEPAHLRHDDTLPDGAPNQWLSSFVERVQRGVDELGELDRRAGDGDFGANMDAALGDIELPLRGPDGEVLHALSTRFLVRSGGTSGAVFGTVFRELAEARDLPSGLRGALDAVTELGGARVGDRTLVDALSPAAECAEQAGEDDVDTQLAACFEAAAEGVRSTRELLGRRGRAAYLGEAARGVVDPGAVVIAWLFGGHGTLADF